MDFDPVVKEVRAVRQKLFRQCHNNLDTLIAFVERESPPRRQPKGLPRFQSHRRGGLKIKAKG